MTDLAFFPLGVAITLVVFLLWDLGPHAGRRDPKAGVCEPCRLARRRPHACEGVLCTCGCGEEKPCS